MVSALPALLDGATVLVDANIFIYAFLAQSEQCARLIQRCRDEELFGVTTVEVVSEVCHRLMIRQAMDLGLIGRPSAVDLKAKRDAIKRLSRYWDLTFRIFEINFLVLPLNEERQRAAQQIRADYGLLTNDSLVVAAAREHGIWALASRDTDFDPIPDLTVYKPSDLP